MNTEETEWDFSAFFANPLIADGKGKHISISDITLRNALFEKMFWLIRDRYPIEDSRAMAFFGRLYEKYMQELTENGRYKKVKVDLSLWRIWIYLNLRKNNLWTAKDLCTGTDRTEGFIIVCCTD